MTTRRPSIGAAGRVLVRLSQVDAPLRIEAAVALARVERLDEFRAAELYMAAVTPREDAPLWTSAEKARLVLVDGRLP